MTDLSPVSQEETLYALFAQFNSEHGCLVSLQIHRTKSSKKQTLPYAVLEFSDSLTAVTAMKELDGKSYLGKQLQ